MKKRLLNCFASDFRKMKKNDLKNAIKASEGRTILSENVADRRTVTGDVTNSELARAFGADLILLNGLDVYNPVIAALPETDEPIKLLKKLTGRPVGLNLEPVDLKAEMLEEMEIIPEGRICSEKTLKKATEMGFDFVCLTGNPGTGVTNEEILNGIKLAKQFFEGMIIAGKMHGAGVNEPVVDIEIIKCFLESGADVIMLPAVGTVPGFTHDEMIKAVKYIKENGGLVMSAIGTSQESSTRETVREIAIMNKIAGVDIQHIGDAGYSGIAPFENIMELSIAVRGVRHTLRMISASNDR
ncbi:MAG: haloacid dehalogenase-like hydrolase [Leptotrichiaceae bacterium]|nr:haloacid dehalogenase-like hydrolase [Leptotrichiaceae bacterium]